MGVPGRRRVGSFRGGAALIGALAFGLILLESSRVAAQPEVYDAVADFSLVQGFRGWSYRTSHGAPLIPDAATQTWRFSDGSLRLWADGGHPGGKLGAMRRWTAPQDGTLQITGMVRDLDPGGGDGIEAQILLGTIQLWRATIDNGNTTGVTFDLTVHVLEGEQFNFVTFRRKQNHYDATYFKPTITLNPPSPDTTPPIVSGVTVTRITPTSARISWVTDEPSSSQVEYGTTPGLGSASTMIENPVIEHHITISDLEPDTLHYFRVQSVDGPGNVGQSGNGTFTTAALPPGTLVFEGASDFSLTQGQGGWTYVTSTGEILQPDVAGLIYPFHGDAWVDAAQKAFLWDDGGIPGPTYDAVRRWTAPEAGMAQVKGFVSTIHPVEQGGMLMLIRRDTATLWQYAFVTGDESAPTFDLTFPVQQGETIDFVIHKNHNLPFFTPDSANFNPLVLLSPPDTAPPVLTNVAAGSVTSTGATITWTSDEASDSQVEYGTTPGYGSVTGLDPALVTAHSVSLGGLQPDTTYHYRVRSTDGFGNLAMSEDGTFTTASGAGEETFNAADDFTLTQGPHWTYLASNGAALTADVANQLWRGTQTNLMLWANGGHPGGSLGAMRRWTAPWSGTAHLMGVVRDLDPGGGNGVSASIRHGTTVLWQMTVANGNTTGVPFDLTVEVGQGETLDFIIGSNGNNSWDATEFNPTIVLTAP